ncbi:MAG: L-2-amino-thiazoline-4-carboxylic acid hydrolase [Gemmatimonadaceae bacterium]
MSMPPNEESGATPNANSPAGFSDLELNAIGVLKRRAIEARILAPMLQALEREFGADRVRAVARGVIVDLARRQGAALAAEAGGCSLRHYAGAVADWTKDDALEKVTLEESDEVLAFNVTRCRYAEMYRALGVPELGALLSCNRDGAVIEGFNPEAELTRTQTIMQGASHCDFRYRLRRRGDDEQ